MSAPIRLYGIWLSHPVVAVRAMLAHKRLSYRYNELLAGPHPVALRALGFGGTTVPAMRLPDGRRVQGSVEIAQALERLAPQPSLYPSDPQARWAAEEAERWAERVLQPVPRRIIRWGLRHHMRQRRWFAQAGTPLPAPALTAILMSPLAAVFAGRVDATDERVRRDLAELPSLLDETDRLLARGVIGGDPPGAADFQIAASLRVLLALQDVEPLLAGRPAGPFAIRLLPDYPPIPAVLPLAWVKG